MSQPLSQGAAVGAPGDPIILSVLPRRLLRQVRRAGGDVDALTNSFRLAKAVEEYPLVLVSLSTIRALSIAAEIAAKDPFIGVHCAEHETSDLLHILAFACSGASTGREALKRYMEHVLSLHRTLLLSVQPTDRGGLVVHQKIPGHPGVLGRHGNEHWIVSLIQGARRLTSDGWAPDRIVLAHAAPKDRDVLVRAVGTTNISFGGEHNSIWLGPEVLDLPIRNPGAPLASILANFSERTAAAAFNAASDLEIEVRAAIEDRLSSGAPVIGDVARTLGTSARTLQRRLADENLTFQGVLDGVRRDIALPHVQRGELSLSEIATKLGYTQMSAFIRSFRRWTGTTPKKARSAPPPAGDAAEDE